MNRLLPFLLNPNLPIWKFCLAAFPLALVPSVAMSMCVNLSLYAAGIDVTHLQPPHRTGSISEWLGSVLFAPIAETLLLAIILKILLGMTQRKWFVAAVSGLLWGAMHAMFGLLWFFGTAWSFFVFSCAYLGWRERSFREAFMAASVPHALINLSVMTSVALERAV